MKRLSVFLFAALACIYSAGAVFSQTTKPDQTITITGKREASEASWNYKDMRYIPVEVPAGVTKITIRMAFDWGTDASKPRSVETGVFDARGHEFGAPGFRGWQWSRVDDIVVTGDRATTTPLYIPGPLYAGTWHIAQRLTRCPNAGLSYTYNVTFCFDGPTPPQSFAEAGCDQGILDYCSGWYPGDMHLHTIRSDGKKTLVESIEQHTSAGYRFMVSTDHNTPGAHYDFADAVRRYPKMLLICGEEWTTTSGHANGVGIRPGSLLDFRVDIGDGNLPAVIDTAHQMDALFVVNHPFSIKWKYPDAEWEKADAIEVWNGPLGPDDTQAIALWASKIDAGRRFGAIGGTDTHGGASRQPATFVFAKNLSQDAIMDGLRNQHVFLSESPKGPMLIISSGSALPGDTVKTDADVAVPVQIQVFGGKGKTLRLIWSSSEEKVEVSSEYYRIDRKLRMDTTQKHWYVRAELLKPDGTMSALTNAIYVE